ncbi:MAG TPA: SAM-dependent methyltransferase [Pseudonocardiaceae bacterium]|jgi:methyltransferase (TIGR00027 family)|nr:SAM-dependent methyltransferase [Pseudonocardiaceae bacterium]
MRTEDDTWDINTSVGVTAVGVAAGRAAESAEPDGLINDPFAARFVRAAAPLSGASDAVEGYRLFGEQSKTYLGVRTRYFDEFFADAAKSGIEQAVILASGLDARPYRTLMPSRSFEIDQPAVLEFKAQVLADADAQARTRHSIVGIDLRDDWRTALIDAGFAPELRTAWLAEGLLPFLPLAAQESLFETIDALSSAGSVISVEGIVQSMRALETDPQANEAIDKLGVSVPDLIFDDRAVDASPWFIDHGWAVEQHPATEYVHRYGRSLPDGSPFVAAVFVTGTKKA